MMKNIWILLLLLPVVGCEKVLMEDDPENTPVENFDLLWENVDRRYSFFEFKDIDWDELYEKYRPQVHNEMSQTELFNVMDDMLFELRDGHVNLSSSFNTSRNWDWRLNSPPNFNYDIVERNYLGADHRITGPFRNALIDSVAYIYYGSFSSSVNARHINLLIRDFNNAGKLIFDVRNNGGGSLSNVERIVERFARQSVLSVYRRYKSGPGHNEFGPRIAEYSEPGEDNPVFEGEVVLLTNRGCYSATNEFVQKMRVLPNVTVLGDTTGGGGGLPFHGELPNGWTYRFSTTQTLTPDGINIEDGIEPDILRYMDENDEQNGKDTLIEEALKLLNN